MNYRFTNGGDGEWMARGGDERFSSLTDPGQEFELRLARQAARVADGAVVALRMALAGAP